jgi:indole-3-glycerol phosphate synthase
LTGPADILLRVVAARRSRLAAEGEPRLPGAGAQGRTPLALGDNALLRALSMCRGSAVIAEVKMGSPRLGSLAGRIDPEAQARRYAENGAAALSVVVEPDHFGGSYELLARCREASGLPTLAKDFVVDRRQLEWARGAGADAVLLIAALYEAEELRDWAAAARRLGLAPLIESHGAEDLAKLDGAGWELVGVNNRDLRTFEVDVEGSVERVAQLPESALKVAESGISSAVEVARLAGAGFDAFLIGESLLLAKDPGAKLRSLLDTKGAPT